VAVAVKATGVSRYKQCEPTLPSHSSNRRVVPPSSQQPPVSGRSSLPDMGRPIESLDVEKERGENARCFITCAIYLAFVLSSMSNELDIVTE
jgi:hypothetical protein